MGIVILIALAVFAIVATYSIFKKQKPTEYIPPVTENPIPVKECKKFQVTPTNSHNYFTYIGCNGELEGTMVQEPMVFCAKEVKSATGLEVIELEDSTGFCN
jgi:hypothetical protein